MKNEKIKNFIFYLICCGIVEIYLVFMFLIASINQHGVWIFFLWVQVGVPFAAFLLWIIVQGIIEADKINKAQEEWNKKVEKVVEIVEKMEKEKNDENIKKNN